MELPPLENVQFILGFELKAVALAGLLYAASMVLFSYSLIKGSVEKLSLAHYIFRLTVIIHGLAVAIRLLIVKKPLSLTPYEDLLLLSFIVLLVYSIFRRSWGAIHHASPFAALFGAFSTLVPFFANGEGYSPSPLPSLIGNASAFETAIFLFRSLGFAGCFAAGTLALAALLFGYSPLKKLRNGLAFTEIAVHRSYYDCARAASFSLPFLVCGIAGEGYLRLSSGRNIMPSAAGEISLVALFLISSGILYMYPVEPLRKKIIIPWAALLLFYFAAPLFSEEASTLFKYSLFPLGVMAILSMLMNYTHPSSFSVKRIPAPRKAEEITSDNLTVGIEFNKGIDKFIAAAKSLGYSHKLWQSDQSGEKIGYLTRGMPYFAFTTTYHISLFVFIALVTINSAYKPTRFGVEETAPPPISNLFSAFSLRGVQNELISFPSMDFGDSPWRRFSEAMNLSPHAFSHVASGARYSSNSIAELSGVSKTGEEFFRQTLSAGKGIIFENGFLTLERAYYSPVVVLESVEELQPMRHIWGDSNYLFFHFSADGKDYVITEFLLGKTTAYFAPAIAAEGEAWLYENSTNAPRIAVLTPKGSKEKFENSSIKSVQKGATVVQLIYTPLLFHAFMGFIALALAVTAFLKVFGRWHRIYFVVREGSLYFNIETAGFFVNKKVIAEYLITALI